MPEATIAAGFVRGLLELAVSKGASRVALLERCGIDPTALQDQDNRLPFAQYVALMRVGKELTGDPALALHFGEEFDMADLSIIGLIGHASETIAEAMVQVNRFQRLGADIDLDVSVPRFEILRDEAGLWMVDHCKTPADFPEFTESFFARVVCGARRSTGLTVPRSIHVTYAAPSYRDEYDRIFQVPVFFESDRNALLVDDKWLNYKNPMASRYAFGVLSERAEALLKKLEASTTTRGRVESLLMPMLHTGDVSMDTVAGKLGLSRQTLHRRLKEEGTTFEKVLDELRHKMAVNYLSGKKVSVNEAAYLVGFSEPAAFSRAFKRWTGSSPSTMRGSMIENGRTRSA